MDKGRKVVMEMEKLEEEFSMTYEAARRHLELLREETSSETSDTITIDLTQAVKCSYFFLFYQVFFLYFNPISFIFYQIPIFF